jgi:hypothetical protein
MMMSEITSVTESLRAAVEAGDLGAIAEGVAALERIDMPEEGSGDAVRVSVQGFSSPAHWERCIGFFETAGFEMSNQTGVNDSGLGLKIETKITEIAKLKVALMDVFMEMDDSELEEDDLRIGVERWQMIRKDRVVLHDRYARPSFVRQKRRLCWIDPAPSTQTT